MTMTIDGMEVGAAGAMEVAETPAHPAPHLRGLTISLHDVGVSIERRAGCSPSGCLQVFSSLSPFPKGEGGGERRRREEGDGTLEEAGGRHGGEGHSGGKKMVLQGVTAVIRSGQMYGLMGPSGAGKTTLLDVISHRLKHPAKRRGDVLYDAHRPTISEVRRDASYVEQNDDVLNSMGHFTVFEYVLFAAMCKLPASQGWDKKAKKIERVDQVLRQMSLDQVKTTVLGNANVGLRGVSGGERKRVAISVGILCNPRAIFLDEPTTGLDSAMAQEVMQIVKGQLQGLETTLVVTIHQPSPVIFEMLDQLILLKAGRVIYMGPGGMEPCAHFASLGYPYRQGYNIAEFLLETLTDKGGSCNFAAEFKATERARSQLGAAESEWKAFLRLKESTRDAPGQAFHANGNPLSKAGSGHGGHEGDSGYFVVTPRGHRRTLSWVLAQEAEEKNMLYHANSQGREIWVLLRYRVAVKWRMGWFIASKLCIPILVGAVYASFFAMLPKSFFGNFMNAGMLFATVALAGFLAIAPLEDFKGEFPLILRQRQDGYYRGSSYVVEKIVQEVPFGLLGALGFAIITYFAIGLKLTPYAFFFYTLAAFVVNMVATATAFAVAANIPTIEFLPQAIINVWSTLNIMVTGFFIPQCQMPVWWKWLYWISCQQWTWSAMMLNQFGSQSGKDAVIERGDCSSTSNTGSEQCSNGIGTLMDRLPVLFQTIGFNSSARNQCVAMNDFTLQMFDLGHGAHGNQWLCLLYASLSLPVFLVLFYVGIWRSTRSRGG